MADLPGRDELQRIAEENDLRNVDDVAKYLGTPVSPFRRHCREVGFSLAHRPAKFIPTLAVDDPQRVKITHLEAANKILKRENRDYEKALASQQDFFDRIVEATRVPVKVPKFKTGRQDKTKKPGRSVIAPIYDMQYGQLVRPEDVPGGRGGFNTRVFDKRLQRYVEGFTGSVSHYATSYTVDELIIPLGGDQVEGDEIFSGQAWQLEIDPVQQVVQLAEKLAGALGTIIEFAKTEIGVPKIGVYCVPGNHGKVGGKKSGARPARYSWDWLLFEMLRDKLRAHPIDQFGIEPAGHLLFGCAGFTFLMIHGDEVKGWGGIPFYGLAKFDGRVQRLHNVRPDYTLLGHHHQAAEIPNGAGEFIVSGDWVGGNNLSRHITATSRPHQKVLFVARKWGVNENAKIWFTEADEAYAPSHVYQLEAA